MELMKEHIKVFTGSNEVQWLYSQDWEYHDYGNCKRYLQIIFPYKREMKKEEKYAGTDDQKKLDDMLEGLNKQKNLAKDQMT